MGIEEEEPLFTYMKYNSELGDLDRFKRDFIGEVENLGMIYNIQEDFNMEGYFPIKATPLGENLSLLDQKGGRGSGMFSNGSKILGLGF